MYTPATCECDIIQGKNERMNKQKETDKDIKKERKKKVRNNILLIKILSHDNNGVFCGLRIRNEDINIIFRNF